MAAGKQTPRQKMINLMYLVFIAMMAMQVDRQVLRSFEDITVTLEGSSKLTTQNNNLFYDQIAQKAEEDPDYVEIKDKADQVHAEADKAFNLIEAIKNEVMGPDYSLPGIGDEERETNYASLQNVDVLTKMFFNKQDGASPKGQELLDGMKGFKEFMTGIYGSFKTVPEGAVERIEALFATDNKGNKSWLNAKFYDQPMVSGLANLTKIQSDIRTEEGNLVRALYANRMEEQIQLKAFQPIVMVPPFVRKDKPADASIAFGAFDNTLQGSVTIDGMGEVALKDGKAEFVLSTASAGKKTLSGKMNYKDGTGEIVSIPFTQEYEVVEETLSQVPSGAVISADAMNVVYRGLDNPISATVNGADGPVSLNASVSGLSSKGPGKWSFKPGAGSSEVTFTASAKTSTGKTVSGNAKFRIKPVPPARAHIAGKTSLQIPANGLAGQTVRVDWPDFLFDVKGQVTSFKVKVPGQPTAVVNGDKMSAAAGTLSKAKSGDVVGVFDIKYSSAAGNGEASAITIEVR